jgi:hypothetical protein
MLARASTPVFRGGDKRNHAGNPLKLTISDRLLLLATCLLAAWQVAVGIHAPDALPMTAYTIGFGVLLVAGLLLIILGFDALESPFVVIISTLIPLSLSLGLVWEYLPACRVAYLVFILLGFLAIVITRSVPAGNRLPVLVLAFVHGIAGMMIFLLPFFLAATGRAAPGFALVGLGGALIGLGGLLLSFLKAGKPILSRKMILKILPGLFFVTTAAFVLGFSAA